MKQDVIFRERSGVVYSKSWDFTVGIVKTDNIPEDGAVIYYDINFTKPLPYKLYKGANGQYYIQ